jgi:hypothetical protein
MATINWNTATRLSPATAVSVSTRATWAASWTSRPEIHAEQCAWTIAPEIATATLRRPFGRVVLPGANTATDLTRIDIRGHFVRIDWTTDEGTTATWLGFAESIVDEPKGLTDGVIPSSGMQTVVCYGLERMLAAAPIRDTVWRNVIDPPSPATRRGGSPIAFNADGRPNRSASTVGGVYVFEPDPTVAQYWTTRQAVAYLLVHQLPTNSGGVAAIPWALANAAVVPDWDACFAEVDGRTVYDVITELIGPRRLMSWTVSWDLSSLQVYPFSMTPTLINLGTDVVPANTVTHTVLFDADPLSRGAVNADGADVVDQVIVRGGRRVSICTLDLPSTSLENDWTNTNQTAYNDAASAGAGYAAKDVYEQRRLNAGVRQGANLANVFRRLRIPLAWDCKVAGDPAASPPVKQNVFIDEANGNAAYLPNPGGIRILPTSGLRRGKTYTGTITAVDTEVLGDLPPLVTLETPQLGRREIQTIGRAHDIAGGEPAWSVQATVPDPRVIDLEVVGAPQHMLGGAGFVPLAADPDVSDGFDIADTRATVAIEEDRFAEGVWPATLSTVDIVRRRVVYVGDGYSIIRVVPWTVVGLSTTAAEQTTDGGYVVDDRAILTQLARLLAAYHTTPRLQMTLATQRRTGVLTVGSIITSVGTAYPTSINALVAKIEILNPEGAGANSMRGASQTITAASVPVDLLTQFVLNARGR